MPVPDRVADKPKQAKPDNELAKAKAAALAKQAKKEFAFAAGLAALLQGAEEEDDDDDDDDEDEDEDENEQEDDDDGSESSDGGVDAMMHLQEELAALVGRLQKQAKIVVKCVRGLFALLLLQCAAERH